MHADGHSYGLFSNFLQKCYFVHTELILFLFSFICSFYAKILFFCVCCHLPFHRCCCFEFKIKLGLAANEYERKWLQLLQNCPFFCKVIRLLSCIMQAIYEILDNCQKVCDFLVFFKNLSDLYLFPSSRRICYSMQTDFLWLCIRVFLITINGLLLLLLWISPK